MKKRNKSKVPQAQNWQSKTTQSRAANKKKKVVNAQVRAQTQTIPNYQNIPYYRTIKWPKSMFAMGTPSFSSSVLTMQDILNFWHNIQNPSQPPMAFPEMIDDTEFLLAFLVHKLGGHIVIDYEEMESFIYDVMQNAGLGYNSPKEILHRIFQHGLNFDTRQKYLQTRSGSYKPKVNINDLVKEDHTEEILQLKALLADGTELRIPRKNFFKAIQEDIQLEVLTEHDEDFVVIRRK